VRLLVLAILIVASPAAAKSWSSPSAGPSASGDPEILFTFDDGPNPVTTPKVLDILAAHHIHAVFFMVGEMVDTQNKKVPAIIQRVLREGHVIANHTMRHSDLCRSKEIDALDAAIADIDNGKAAIEKIAGVPMLWFRAPYGVRCDRLDELLSERGITHFHWDLDPQEWKTGNLKQTVSYVTRAFARVTDRKVLLMHDIKRVTVRALPEILTWMEQENLRRVKANRRPIRIVQAPEIAIEQLPKGLPAWAADVTARLAGLRTDLARVLP
jgi:peptidoglycan/xylan/chitin deacetylase (PgdA/CDA1 family)